MSLSELTPPPKFSIADAADPFLQAEWLEADGQGGFASGTVGGARSRRYHALLLTAIHPPTSRMVLVNGFEAWCERDGQSVKLSTQRYAPDVLYPEGWQRITSFRHVPWPLWQFSLPDGGSLTQEIFAARDTGETVLRFSLSGTANPWVLKLRLLLSGRDYGDLHRENPYFNFQPEIRGTSVTWRPYTGVPAVTALTNGAYAHAPEWYRNFLYAQERDRGLDDIEDLASPGVFSFALDQHPAAMILRAGETTTPTPAADQAEALAVREQSRRSSLSALGAAAESYVAARGSGRTIIAGFPWFTDWGRDSFIALRGLAITRGDFATAEAVLVEWAGTVSEGMLPNRFPDDGGAPEFNAVDASLWFIIAVHDFLKVAQASEATRKILCNAAEAILQGYEAGTRFGIKADTDGLLRAGVPGVQLTWMDAKTGDHVITPRIGKPIEVQALWINALRIVRGWTNRWIGLEFKASGAFRRRFPIAGGGLCDVVDADHIPGKIDSSLRPNQIFAVGGLPFPILQGAAALAVVQVVEAELLTPLGLRTLSPKDSAYIGHYRGDVVARDAAYHQGTVWPWLMGPFIEAWLRVHGDHAETREEARMRFLNPLLAHLETNGLGHLTEVADGDAPHFAGGCPFQAWSLGELIRIQSVLSS